MRAEDVETIRTTLAQLGRAHRPDDVVQAMTEAGMVVSDAAVLWLLEELRTSSVGAGPLERWVREPGVTDVLVNGPGQVFIDRGRGLELTGVKFGSDAEVRALATRMAAAAGRRLDDACPWVDARLADGTRVHAVLSVLADPGTCISLRVPSRRSLTLDDWQSFGSINDQGRHLLEAVVASGRPFLISGGTGTGKTTLLASLLGTLGAGQRLVVVEDSRELRIDHPHVVRLEGRSANAEGTGGVALTDLVRQALRMRPDRLVLGEARGAELCDLLMALNTGHEGGCGTIHANSVTDLPARLEALAALGGMDADTCRAQASAAISVVLHLQRGHSGRRRLAEIGVVARRAPRLTVELAASWDEDGQLTRHDAWDELAELVGGGGVR